MPVAGPPAQDELRRFIDTFIYDERGFLVDEVTLLDSEQGLVEATMDTRRPLPITALQKTDEQHPAHVSAPELLILTGNLGCLHAWFFHGCRWDEGWVGFGNRIHRADFKWLARIGPPLRLESKETRSRVGPQRVVLRYEFRFWQEDKLVYYGDQSAIFVKDKPLV
jgi:hypothetical protein